MKKFLLLSVTALAAFGMLAQVLRYSDMKQTPVTPAPTTDVMEQAEASFDVQKTASNSFIRKAPKANEEQIFQPWFYRPAGCFYGMYIQKDENESELTYSTTYCPYIHSTPFQTFTWINASTGSDSTVWDAQQYNRTTKAKEWSHFTTQDLAQRFILENDTTPVLTGYKDGVAKEYYLKGGKVTSKELQSGEYRCQNLSRVDYESAFTNTSGSHLWYSPKFMAANTNRDFTKLAGSYYKTGAKDADGGTTGRWFGRNYSGVDGICMGFEKPDYPYALRRVGVRFQMFITTGDVTLHAYVYRLDSLPLCNDSLSVKAYPKTLIAQGTRTVNYPTSTSGILAFDLTEEEDGLVYNVTPHVDYPILIEITGYNDSKVEDFTALYSSDVYEEGHGELAYLKRKNTNTGEYEYCGINNFFTSGTNHYGISVLADIERPYFVYNYTSETGEYNFAAEGERRMAQVYTYRGVDEWSITDENDQDIPNWLTVDATDSLTNGEFSHLSNVYLTAEPLPEGTEYRECNVKMLYAGAVLYYKVTQGTKPSGLKGDVNQDGKVDTSDLTDLMNIILNNGTAADNPTADVNGDGKVDTSDISALMNIILGA